MVDWCTAGNPIPPSSPAGSESGGGGHKPTNWINMSARWALHRQLSIPVKSGKPASPTIHPDDVRKALHRGLYIPVKSRKLCITCYPSRWCPESFASPAIYLMQWCPGGELCIAGCPSPSNIRPVSLIAFLFFIKESNIMFSSASAD